MAGSCIPRPHFVMPGLITVHAPRANTVAANALRCDAVSSRCRHTEHFDNPGIVIGQQHDRRFVSRPLPHLVMTTARNTIFRRHRVLSYTAYQRYGYRFRVAWRSGQLSRLPLCGIDCVARPVAAGAAPALSSACWSLSPWQFQPEAQTRNA